MTPAYLSKHFTFAEMIRTSQPGFAASQAKEASTPRTLEALTALCKTILDPIRERAGKPVHINSGYRGKELNKKIGGSPTSQHSKGEAADLTLRTTEAELFNLFRWIAFESKLPFGQVIFEDARPDDPTSGAWIHVSLGTPWRPAARSGMVLLWTPKGGYQALTKDPGPR